MDVGVSINRVLRVALLQPMSAKQLSSETLSEAIRGMKHSIKVLERNGVSDPDEPDKYGHIVSIKFDSDEDKKAYTDKWRSEWTAQQERLRLKRNALKELESFLK
jgi:hypothetical protein